MTASPTAPQASPQNSHLQRPLLLVLLALSFVLSPFFNLASALYVGHHPSWFLPSVWVQLFLKLSVAEQAIMVAGPIVGILLFVQQKRSWTLAVALVISATVFNLFFGTEAHAEGLRWLSAFNVFTTVGLIGILYFFRYPYLDQRDSISMGPAQRFQVNIQCELENFGNCRVTNISKTGCHVADVSDPKFSKGSNVLLKFERSIEVKCTVIHLHKGIGLRFVDPSTQLKALVQRYMEDAKGR